MEKSYLLDNNAVATLNGDYTVEALQKKYEKLENDYQRQSNEAHSRWVQVMSRLSAEDREEQQKLYNQGKALFDAKYAQSAKEYELLKKYGESFAQLYKIKDEAEKYGDFEEIQNHDGSVIAPRAQIVFEEIVQQYPTGGMMSTADHYQLSANMDEGIEQLALRINLEDEEIPEFYVSMLPSDGNKSRVTASLVVDNEELKKFDFDNPEKIAENKEKIRKILNYLEEHGLDPLDFDIPYEVDGIEEFKPSKVKDEARKVLQERFTKTLAVVQNEIKAKNAQLDADEIHQNEIDALQKQKQKGEDVEQLSDIKEIKLPENGAILSVQTNEFPKAVKAAQSAEMPSDFPPEQGNRVAATDENVEAPAPAVQHKSSKAPTYTEAVDKIRNFIEEGLAKKKDLSYWESRSFFTFSKSKRNTVQFTIYADENPDNAKNDGQRDDKGNKRLTYVAKLFVQKMDDGKLGFYYKTPHNKKIDELIVNGLAGQFKSLGYTHMNFPKGIPDAEKGMWRKALAEQGIVPKGIGLDRSKAQGMIKAASEKLSSEQLSMFKYRLALQMKENNYKKGKKVDESEKVFIDGLINSYHYEPFTGGFAEHLKSALKKTVAKGNEDRQKGAVTKIAAYTAMRRLFDIYKECVFEKDILSSRHLSPEEVRMLKSAGLTGPIKEMKPHVMGAVYDILLARCKKEADEKIQFDIEHEPTPKRSPKLILNDAFNGAKGLCESINEDLAAMGVDEIKFPSAFGPMYYPLLQQMPQQTNNQQNQQQTGTPQTQRAGMVENVSQRGGNEL